MAPPRAPDVTSGPGAGAERSPDATARAVGLHHVSDHAPGIRRRRRGRGFSYHGPDGELIRDSATADRIRSLAIPPAWRDVWICIDPLGHLQATGRDDRGRKQYRYHPTWCEVRGLAKFERLAEFGAALPALRAAVDEQLSASGLGPDRVVALVVHLLDDTLVRIGNERYALDNETFGLTTLRQEHLESLGRTIRLAFPGKSGIEHDVELRDARVTRVVRRCHELGGQHLFTWRSDDGEPVPVTSQDVNEALRRWSGLDTSAKDFRTWGGTVRAVEHLATLEDRSDPAAEIVAAVDAAAEQLRNTRAVCRASYVHPAVLEAHERGAVRDAWRESRATARHTRAERATLSLLR